MSNIQIILLFPQHPDLRLRSINVSDIEDLRAWKNANKNSFFLNQDITSEQQLKWYTNFSGRPHDHMFIVEQHVGDKWRGIGCMGFRKLEEEGCVDGYNIIRSLKIEPATFTMSEAFKGMLAYAASEYEDLPLQVKVLTQNPAVKWYEKNGFTIISREKDHVLMEMDKDILKNIQWTIKSTI